MLHLEELKNGEIEEEDESDRFTMAARGLPETLTEADLKRFNQLKSGEIVEETKAETVAEVLEQVETKSKLSVFSVELQKIKKFYL